MKRKTSGSCGVENRDHRKGVVRGRTERTRLPVERHKKEETFGGVIS